MTAIAGPELDQLEAFCLCAIAAHDVGRLAPLVFADVAGRWTGDGVLRLNAAEREALTYHRPDTLDWTELVLPDLVRLLVDAAGEDWVVEALSRSARLVAVRTPRITLAAPAAATTGLIRVRPAPALITMLCHAFPSAEDQVPLPGPLDRRR
jgi:hypothetical protein